MVARETTHVQRTPLSLYASLVFLCSFVSVLPVSSAYGMSLLTSPPFVVSNLVVYASGKQELSAFNVETRDVSWSIVLPSTVLEIWPGTTRYFGVSCGDKSFRIIDGLTGLTQGEVRVDGRVVGICGEGDPLILRKLSNDTATLIRQSNHAGMLWEVLLSDWGDIYYGVHSLGDTVIITGKSRYGEEYLPQNQSTNREMTLRFVDARSGTNVWTQQANASDGSYECDGSRYRSQGDVILCPIGKRVFVFSRMQKKVLFSTCGQDAVSTGKDEIGVAREKTLVLCDAKTGTVRRTIPLVQAFEMVNFSSGKVFDGMYIVDVNSGKFSERHVMPAISIGAVLSAGVVVGNEEFLCATRRLEQGRDPEVWLARISLLNDSVVWSKGSGATGEKPSTVSPE